VVRAARVRPRAASAPSRWDESASQPAEEVARAHGERSITGRGGEVLLLTECALMYSKVMHCLHALPVSEKRSKSIYASCSQPVPGGSR